LLPIILKTPSTVETEGGIMEIREGANAHYKLRDQIAMLPTPATRDWKGAVSIERTTEKIADGKRAPMCALDNFVVYHGKSPGLRLQPAFVEWMMGFPPGFTDIERDDLKPWETLLSRKSHTKSSKE